MIPIPIVVTEYTATLHGRTCKCVPCGHCGTEYVYVLEREGVGAGTSFYLLNEDGAQEQAKAGAEEALRSYLENDFDPVPCPSCGHYQRYMFPKLYDGGSTWGQLARLVVLVVGCSTAVGAVYWGITYVRQPDATVQGRFVLTLGLLAILGLIDCMLRAAERSRARRFDPNTEDQQARIAKGRSRAVTRAEFEAEQRREREARDRFIEHLREKARQDEAKREPEPPRPESA